MLAILRASLPPEHRVIAVKRDALNGYDEIGVDARQSSGCCACCRLHLTDYQPT
jgi:hypothetical protein